MAMSAVSKTVNPGSNPGSPARRTGAPQLGGPCVFPFQMVMKIATRGLGRVAAIACVAGLLALALAASSSPAVAVDGTDCRHAEDSIGDATLGQLRKAVRCLINVERTERDRRPLRVNDELTLIAKRHTRVMLEENCFEHECPGERPLRKRIETSGYVKPGERYGYGENLGCSQTPKGMVDAWMNSANRYHRRNILDRQFRHFGIGAARGAPGAAGEGCAVARTVTYTVIFGWRRR